MKDQLDVTCYFISLLMCSTCFGHSYIHHQELATVLMNYHIGRLVLSSLCVGDLVRLVLGGARFVGWSKLLMMDILMSETCWAHKKWNKIASDIKLAFHSSTISFPDPFFHQYQRKAERPDIRTYTNTHTHSHTHTHTYVHTYVTTYVPTYVSTYT